MKFIEGSYLVLKEVINADFKKEIIAFSNTDGGEIYVLLLYFTDWNGLRVMVPVFKE